MPRLAVETVDAQPFRKKDLHAEVARFVKLYNTVLERNWGFVPLTEEEVYHYAKDLKPILDENWAMFAERKDTGGSSVVR